jgi:hypothetical protein
MANHSETSGWIILGIIGAILLWLFRGGANPFLHEAVGATLIPSQPSTGIPQYDSSNPATLPSAVSRFFIGPLPPPVAPVGSIQEGITSRPADPLHASCPIGYTLWYDVHTNSYSCWPSYGDAMPVTGGDSAGLLSSYVN